MKYFFDTLENDSKANKKIFAKTNLIQNVTEDIMIAMEDLDISKSQLAKKIGKSKSYITQILSGSRNMTLTSLSDLCFELNIIPEVKILDDAQLMEDDAPTSSEKSYPWHRADLLSECIINSKKANKKAISIGSHPDYKYRKVAA